jgi:hypothetical protein
MSRKTDLKKWYAAVQAKAEQGIEAADQNDRETLRAIAAATERIVLSKMPPTATETDREIARAASHAATAYHRLATMTALRGWEHQYQVYNFQKAGAAGNAAKRNRVREQINDEIDRARKNGDEITIAEAARRLKIAKTTAYNAMNSGA